MYKIWYKLLLLFCIISLIIFIVKKTAPSFSVMSEGFGAQYSSDQTSPATKSPLKLVVEKLRFSDQIQMNQKEKFLVKYDDQIYDSFYSDVYDTLNKTESRTTYELKKIIQTTQATTDNSMFLDIGCGSGNLVDTLQTLGYDAYGVDKSEAMISYSDKKYPDAMIKLGDVTDPMCYDKGIFTHILCLHFTIYHIEKKHMFFKNCYSWTKPGGYLVVHLVERDKFYKATSAAHPILDSLLGQPQIFLEETANDAVINFDNFLYKHSYQISPSENKAVFTETFTDKATSNIRQQEQTLYMEETKDILSMAAYYGFILQGKIDIQNKKHENLYIFERAL